MTRLILCRHGATEWNLQGRYQGSADVPLNDEGLRQAQMLADELSREPIDAVYASALQRAWRTAEHVAERHDLQVTRDARLNEIDEGKWEGMTLAEIVAAYPTEHALWVERPLQGQPVGGESIAQLCQRTAAAVRDICDTWPEATVVIVSHKVAINTIRSLVTGEDLESAVKQIPLNASVFRCEWRPTEVGR